MTLDRFYPIFDSCDWLRRMLPLGVKLVQLRIKDAPLDIVRREIVEAKALCDAHGAVLVVNDTGTSPSMPDATGCIWGRKIWMMPT